MSGWVNAWALRRAPAPFKPEGAKKGGPEAPEQSAQRWGRSAGPSHQGQVKGADPFPPPSLALSENGRRAGHIARVVKLLPWATVAEQIVMALRMLPALGHHCPLDRPHPGKGGRSVAVASARGLGSFHASHAVERLDAY